MRILFPVLVFALALVCLGVGLVFASGLSLGGEAIWVSLSELLKARKFGHIAIGALVAVGGFAAAFDNLERLFSWVGDWFTPEEPPQGGRH